VKKIFNDIRETELFLKDLKKLKKKYRTLVDDIRIFIETQLNLFHKLKIDNRGVIPYDIQGYDCPVIYKVKKFACKSLKGKGVASGIRIIYSYDKNEDVIEFIEIYFKADQENEDKERIRNYLKKFQKA